MSKHSIANRSSLKKLQDQELPNYGTFEMKKELQHFKEHYQRTMCTLWCSTPVFFADKGMCKHQHRFCVQPIRIQRKQFIFHLPRRACSSVLFNILTVIGSKKGRESEIIPFNCTALGDSTLKVNNFLVLILIMFILHTASPLVMQNCVKSINT